jgi:hypothetical protein
MSKNRASRRKEERRITVRAVRRDPPDLRKFARAILTLAMAQAEADARADSAKREVSTEPPQQHPPAGDRP